jgi:hypothetical protein
MLPSNKPFISQSINKSSVFNEHIFIFGFTIVYAVFVFHEYNLSIRLNESDNLTCKSDFLSCTDE